MYLNDPLAFAWSNVYFLLNSLRYRIIFSRSQTILKEKLIIRFLPSTFYSDMAVRSEATAHFRQYLLYPGGDQPD